MAAGGGWLAVPAGAQSSDPSDCNAAVVDTSGQLDVSAVEAAMAAEPRAQIVVRGFDSVPDGDLVGRINQFLGDCFLSSNSQITPDLAVFSFSVTDRKADVYLGRALPAGTAADELRATMSAGFPSGQFTVGVLDGVSGLSRQLDAASNRTPATRNDGSAPAPAGSSPANRGLLLSGVAGLAVLAAGATGTAIAVGRRRRLNESRTRLAASLAEPRIRVGAMRERGAQLETQSDLWARTVNGRALGALERQRRAARAAIAATEGAASLLTQATPNGLGQATSSEIVAATNRLSDLTVALDANQKALDSLLVLGARFDHLRVALPAKRELLFGELAAAETLSDQRHAEGWKVDEPEAALTSIRAELESCDLKSLALDLLDLSDRIEGAEAALFAADHDLQSLPDRPGAIVAWRDKQNEAAELEERRAEAAIRRLADTTPAHAPDSWQWAAGHPDKALAHLRTAAEQGDAAVELARSQQRFDDAGRTLEAAGMDLIAADELLDQVEDLLVDLDQAKESAARILAESRQVLAELTAYVQGYRGDLEPAVAASPARIGEALSGLDAELAGTRPNYLRVAQTADRINREVDELMVVAKEQHEHMDALRRQAAREIDRASRSLMRARESLGWELFASDDSKLLDALDEQLSTLPADPAVRLSHAGVVADQALAVQERIIARRRRQANWVVVGGGAGGWSRGGSFGGGSGGGSFGGGGSGGQSFGGGRSSGSW